MASLGTPPYHGRAFLAHLHSKGFISPTAWIGHRQLHIGDNVYIGDWVTISQSGEGGPIEFAKDVHLYGDSFISTGMGGSLKIDSATHIQPGCHIHAFLSEIQIGKNVEIAPNCAFYCYNHSVAPGKHIMHQPLESKGSIVVGDGVWIGHGSVILAGVKIGNGAVIGAGALVSHDIPENAIAIGSPARVLKFRK